MCQVCTYMYQTTAVQLAKYAYEGVGNCALSSVHICVIMVCTRILESHSMYYVCVENVLFPRYIISTAISIHWTALTLGFPDTD